VLIADACVSTGGLAGSEESHEDEKMDKEEVRSAIRYLDPDEREKDKEVNTATIIATLCIVLIVGGV